MRERRILRLVMVIAFAMSVLLPAFNILFLNPAILKLLTSELESDALRTSVHLSREGALLFSPEDKAAFQESFFENLRTMKREFDLFHVNVYAASGELVSPPLQADSSVDAQWEFDRSDLMGMKSPRIVTGEYAVTNSEKYLSAITVPIIRDGMFDGAFQFFFDVTDFKKRADVLVWSSTGFLLFMASGFLAMVLSASMRAGRAFQESERTQEALQLSERKFFKAFNDSPDWVLLSRLRDGTIVDANSTFIRAKGYEYNDIIGKTALDLGIWNSDLQREEVLRYLQNRGHVRNVELHPYVEGGSDPAMLLSADIIEVKDEQFILKVLRDVTDLRRAEQSELELLRELRIIFDNMPMGIAYLNHEMRFISANRFFMDFVGLKEHELVGKQCAEVMAQRMKGEDDRSGGHDCLSGLSSVEEISGSGRPLVVERKIGDVFSRMTMVPERTADGSLKRLVFLLEDISEQKHAEADILDALREKEVLLKEIHHRVKNNLQVISSLLNLQSRVVGDEALIAAFRESQARVKSMALIHESLYQSEDLSLIDAKRYLRQLGTYLFQTYGIDPGKIHLKLEAQDVRLSVDLAMPCGLIVNELLTNALKYAFPSGTGEMLVSMDRTGDAYRLVVKDNGIGYADMGSEEKSGALGFRLVETLVSQLDGTMQIHQDGGFEVVIEFSSVRAKGE